MQNWYALRTKPKKEKSAAVLLKQAGIEIFFPEIHGLKLPRKPITPEPLFPGYLFGRLNPDRNELRLVRYTQGIMYIVGFDGEPQTVPDDVIHGLQDRLAHSRAHPPSNGFKAGERLVISTGPLRGLDAIFDRHESPSGRVRVFLQILRRLCPTELHASQLKRPA